MRDTRTLETHFAPGLGRRPIPARSAPWARRLAHALAGLGVHPNAISLAGLGFALLGAGALWAAGAPGMAGRTLGSLGAALAIPLRLLMNLLDGMVAEARGGPSRAGELFNEVPDRIADAVLLIAAGWASLAPVGRALGWIAALLALFTAYVRTLGGALGVPGLYGGPMAKPQRMAALGLGCVLAAGEALTMRPPRALVAALAVISAGSVLTSARRLAHIARALERR